MEPDALTKGRREVRYGVAFLSAGLLCAIGAWRVIVRHEGFLPVGLPLAALGTGSALLARRPRRGEGA
ncbi:MAG: hypothetical protein HOQ10_13490 [Frateuria sp.]|uniref:hypothetical protein n=1 Tax=Frateuria sp. TaxID=2211372 RepID=UPI0018456BC1|nr:hypothetical protein [Frateuria sp.]NUO73713.1 hypothetical protein [Frateuria sp.]NUR21453.1 hypothetical protein [Frateuria sp.]